MDYISDEKLNALEEYSPELIAETIFNKNPDKPCSNQILAMQENNYTDASFIFEIMLTIFLEGIMILYNQLTDVVLDNVTTDHLVALRPWLWSLGFDYKVTMYDSENEYSTESYNDYYCKIILKKDQKWTSWFDTKNVLKEYFFLLNAKYANGCDKELGNVYAIMIVNKMIFKLEFKHYVPQVNY